MKDGGRLAAAIEILTEIEARRRPANLVLADWGKANRFAGSSDRAWIAGLVLDILRRRRSLAWRMEDDSPRAAAIAALRFAWDWPAEAVAAACIEEPHGPGRLKPPEAKALLKPRQLRDAPPPVRGDYPDWLDPHFERVFAEGRADQLAAMAARAPLDLRVNTLKATPAQALGVLESLGAVQFGRLETTLRIAAPAADLRVAPIEAHPAFARGWVEIQDAGSQVAAAQAGDVKGLSVLDLCAGGGGKTLALAAAMENTGQLYAYDSDARRMKDIIPRADRAGVTNLDVRTPMDANPLADLTGRMDLVFVDAPCTGTGTWRRHPDTKWKLKPALLEHRIAEQDAVLDQAAAFVKPGGRIVYVTCSLLAEENEDRITAFVARHPAFKPAAEPLRLTPRDNQTDGFFAAVSSARVGWVAPRFRPPQIHARARRMSAPAHEHVLIIDFGSQVTQLIARRVRESGVYCEIVPYDKAEAVLDDFGPAPSSSPAARPACWRPTLPPSARRCSSWACPSLASATASS